MTKTLWLSCFFVLGLLAAREGHAAPVVEEARPEAKRLKEEGAKALERGDYAEALARFQQAYRVFPSPRLQYNMGLALIELHRPLEAAEAFEAFLQGVVDAPAEASAHARAQLVEIEHQLGHLEINCDVPAATVTIDDHLAGMTPLPGPVRVNPGKHRIEIAKAGYRNANLRANVGAGNTWTGNTVLLSLTDATRTSRHLAPALVAAGAVLAAGIGAGLRISAQLSYNDLEESCSPSCLPERWAGLPAREYTGDAFLGVAAALAVVDVALWIVDVRRGRPRRAAALAPGPGMALQSGISF